MAKERWPETDVLPLNHLCILINYILKQWKWFHPMPWRIPSDRSLSTSLIGGWKCHSETVTETQHCMRIYMSMLKHCLEWYKWVLTNFYYDRQWFNTLIPLSHEWLLTVFHAWVDPWGYDYVIPHQTFIVEIGGMRWWNKVTVTILTGWTSPAAPSSVSWWRYYLDG